jgi:hypothetical protein
MCLYLYLNVHLYVSLSAAIYEYLYLHIYTGRFIKFSVITNIYNKKTKGLTLMELFTATRKLKKGFFWQLEMSDVCTTGYRHTSIRYSSSCHTRINMGASIFFTVEMIRALRSARSRGNGWTYIHTYVRSTVRKLRTRHAVVTGTHLSLDYLCMWKVKLSSYRPKWPRGWK